MSVSEILLKLSMNEKKERKKVEVDYYFYQGACEDIEKAKNYLPYYGQNWENRDDVDYIPTQDIRNKVKPILKKQARWMFSKEPSINIIPFDITQSKKADELRQWIDNILRKTQFWKKTRQAFLNCTIKKRVMLRAAAKDNGYLNLRYDDVENFSYEEIDGEVVLARFFEEDKNNVLLDDDNKKMYYVHEFSYESIIENEPLKAVYKIKKYSGSDLENPIEEDIIDIGYEINKIPVWLIKNGGELDEEFGETDLRDLKPIQQGYNKLVSDSYDALRFGLFGAESVVDGKEDDVNNFRVVPGALHAVHTDEIAATQGKQAVVQRLEYNMSNMEALEKYLDRAEKDMHYIIDLPDLSDLNNIPSAKAMRYLYNDLIARCEEKWNDWGPMLEEVIRYIINIAEEARLTGFKTEWNNLEYVIQFTHNYPIPQDEDEKKQVAINEVNANVRSRQGYIKEFGSEEDYKKEFSTILNELSLMEGASIGEFETINTTIDKNEAKINNKESITADDDKSRAVDEE